MVEDGAIVGRRSEIGAVKDLEEFRPKLHATAFRNTPKAVILEEREIQIRKPRPNHRITAQISPQVRWIGKSQALPLNVVVGIAGVAERLTTGAGAPVSGATRST